MRPRTTRIVVDLPAPLGPRKPWTSPGATSRSSPSRARTGPKVLVSASVRMTGWAVLMGCYSFRGALNAPSASRSGTRRPWSPAEPGCGVDAGCGFAGGLGEGVERGDHFLAALLRHGGDDGCDLGPSSFGDLADQSRPFVGQADKYLSPVCLVLFTRHQVGRDEAVHHAHGGGGGNGESFGELVEPGVSVAFQDNEGAELGDCDRVLNARQRSGGHADQCA